MENLPWFYDLKIVVVVTLILTIISHLLFIFILPKNTLFWKEVEFAWLAVSISTAIAALHAIEVKNSESNEYLQDLSFAKTTALLEKSIQYALYSDGCIQWKIKKSTANYLKKEENRLIAGQCSWMENANRIFVGNYGQKLPKDYPQIVGSRPASNNHDFFTKFDIAWDAYIQLLSKPLQKEKDFSKYLKMYLNGLGIPLFLFALSIKLTKTSAEILIEAKKNNTELEKEMKIKEFQKLSNGELWSIDEKTILNNHLNKNKKSWIKTLAFQDFLSKKVKRYLEKFALNKSNRI